MCLSCVHLMRKCNHLAFNQMRILDRSEKGYAEVACNQFARDK